MVSSMAWVRYGGPLGPAPHGPRCATATAQGEVYGERTVLPASARCESVLLHGLDRSMVEDIVRQGADHAHIGDRSIGIDCEGNPNAALDAATHRDQRVARWRLAQQSRRGRRGARKSAVEGKGVSVRVDLGGGRH